MGCRHVGARRHRQASAADVAVATEWVQAFQVEAGMHPVGSESLVRDRIADDRLWRWEDDDGTLVSLAARQRTVAGVSRIGPVYPPPACRRHGFGAAVTWACTADALAHDAKHVVLFTDLASPTSNAIYQEIGYRPIADREVVRFLPWPSRDGVPLRLGIGMLSGTGAGSLSPTRPATLGRVRRARAGTP